MHAVVFTGILKTHTVHENESLFLRHRSPLNIGLLDKNAEKGVLVPTKSNNTHIGTGKDGIVNNNPIQRQTQDIIMLECYKLTYKSVRDVKKNSALSSDIISLRDR